MRSWEELLLEGKMSDPTVPTTTIPEFSRLRQKGSKFEGKMGHVVKSCLTKQLKPKLVLAIQIIFEGSI